MANSSQKPSPNFVLGVIACFGGMFMHLVIGSLYQWGIINVYITSYYHLMDNTVTLESTAIAFPLMMMCIGLTMKPGIFFAQKAHPLLVIIIGQVLNAAFIFISSFMQNIWLFIFFYGILFGLSAGLNFTNIIFECNKYLPGKKMYVNGLILVGTGSGAMIFGPFSYNYINPDQIQPLNGLYIGNDTLQYIANQVPILLRWLSLFYLVIGLLGALMISPVCIQNRKVQNEQERINKQKEQQQNPEQSNGFQLQNWNQPEKQQKTKQKMHAPVVGSAHNILESIRTRVFLVTILIVFLGSCGCFFINGNYKTYVKNVINDDKFLTTVGVVGAVGNGCSRFFWNLFFSKTGYKTVCLTILSICLLVLSTIRASIVAKQVYLIEVFLINCCLGGLFVLTPTSALYIYGNKTGTNIYGIYWEAFTLANFMGYIYVSRLTKIIGFDNVIYVCLGMAILAVPLVVFTKFQGPWENDTVNLEYFVGREIERKKRLQSKVRSGMILLQVDYTNDLLAFSKTNSNDLFSLLFIFFMIYFFHYL